MKTELLFSPQHLVHKDARRAIYEMNFEDCSIQGFAIKDRLALGKHAHRVKTEVFKIVAGEGVVLTVPLKDAGEMCGVPTTTPIKAGDIVHIKPLTGHTFYLKPGSKMICFSSEPFDEANQDFLPCPDLVE